MSGSATVVDAGSIRLSGKTINLSGIGAPGAGLTCHEPVGRRNEEYGCGLHAKAFLSSLISGRSVFCVTAAAEETQRVSARCYVDGKDLAEAMVTAGWAIASDRSSSRYITAQESARSAQRGMWAGQFDLPKFGGTGSVRIPR